MVPKKGCFCHCITRTIDYGTTITFYANIENPHPNTYIAWYIDGEYRGKGDSITVEIAEKSFTVQAKYFPSDGGLAYDVSEMETVNVKTGFFARLKAFFRALFKKLPVIAQAYLGAEFRNQ